MSEGAHGFDPYNDPPKEGAPPPYVRLKLVDPRDLKGLPIPPRQWVIDEWLPVGVVTLSYGDGGVGKTLLAQQLMTCCATGRPWFGIEPKQCRVFAIFCEDDEHEVHRRQEKINAHLRVEYDDLGDMRYACPVGEDNILVRFERDGSWDVTPRFVELMKAAQDFGAGLIVIDTAADTFGGSENDRAQVRAYLGAVLTKLARDTDAAVIVNAHPSRTGMSSTGDMDGGSTGWSNTARSRWALIRPTDEEGNLVDEASRILSRRKANYSSIGEEIELKWADGVLVSAREPAPTFMESVSRVMGAEIAFLALLEKLNRENRFVSSSRNAGNFAPKVMAKHPDHGRHTRRDLETAMDRLFGSGRIVNLAYGRKSDERFRIALADDPTPTPKAEQIDPEIASWRQECADAGFPLPERGQTPDDTAPNDEPPLSPEPPPKPKRGRKPKSTC